ncbi:unnamed protein product [Mucor circinelloides]
MVMKKIYLQKLSRTIQLERSFFKDFISGILKTLGGTTLYRLSFLRDGQCYNPRRICDKRVAQKTRGNPNLRGTEVAIEHISQSIYEIFEENCHSILFFGD